MRRLVDLLLVVVPAAVLMLLPRLLAAQEVPLDSGLKVRLTGRATGRVPLVARVLEVRADTLVLGQGPREPIVLLASELDALEVEAPHAARSDAVAAGAVLGLVGGSVAGYNLCRGRGLDCWLIEHDANHDGDMDDEDDSLLPGVGTLTVGAIALVGAGIGALLTPARWRRIGGAAASPVRVGVTAARRGVGFVVRVPFGGTRDAERREAAAR